MDIIREGDSLWVSVLDEGKGISTKDQKNLFNKFGKVDETQVNKHEGTGLGLAFVKELSEALDTEVGELKLKKSLFKGVGRKGNVDFNSNNNELTVKTKIKDPAIIEELKKLQND